MELDGIGRHAGYGSYIDRLSCNHENEGKTKHLLCMLHSVYTVIGVSVTRCMLYLVSTQDDVMERHREMS
jgi:hypothetical protein